MSAALIPIRVVAALDTLHAACAWLTPDDRGRYLGRPVSARWRKARACLAQHVVRAIGDRPVTDLNAGDVWALQQQMLADGLAHSTVNHVSHALLRAMLRDLEVAGIIGPEVAMRCRHARPLRLVRDPRPKTYTAAQRDRAIAAFDGHWAQPAVAFLFLTGARVGEMAGLQWGDVDLRGRQVAISRSRMGLEITPCKTAQSQRVIDIPERLVAILAPLHREADGFVFRGRHGKPVDIHTFRAQAWYPVLEAAGLPVLHVHGARHTVATLLLMAGVPVAQVAAHLGDRPRVVEQTYAHCLPRFDVDAAMSPPDVFKIAGGRARLRLVK